MSNSSLLLIGLHLDTDVVEKILWYVLLVLSLTFHEYGHAWSAKKLGDDTAERLGRLSLNPLVHLDPIFTVLLPLFFLFFAPSGSGIFFCAAKPVPVNPFNLGKPTRDMTLTSIAGPAMNIVLALFFTGAFWFHLKLREIAPDQLSSIWIMRAIQMNLGLAVFNMLPIPPLDGHRVVGYFLPAALRQRYYQFGAYGMVVLLLLMQRGVIGNIMGPVLDAIGGWWAHLMPYGIPPFGDG